MELDADAFNDLIANIGQRVEWRRGYACPCVSASSGAANSACRHCFGMGRIWAEPVPAVVGRTGAATLKKWAQFGMYDDGDAVMIVGCDSPAYAIGPYDRVLAIDQTEPFSLNLTRRVNDRIAFSVDSIEKVLAIGEDGALVNHGLPDVNQHGQLEWATGGPPPGQTYSVTGRRVVEYFAYTNQPFDRPHHQGEPLPRNIVLKRFDLFGR